MKPSLELPIERQHNGEREFLCSKCGEYKSLSEFTNTVRPRKDKACIPCRKKHKNEWANKDREKDGGERSRINARNSYANTKEKNRDKRNKAANNYRFKCPESRLISHAKQRAKDKGIEFNLTTKDILPLPKVCPILGTVMKVVSKGSPNWGDSYSLDRIDNSKGYISNNVAVISRRANIIKNDGTLEEHKMLIKWWENL